MSVINGYKQLRLTWSEAHDKSTEGMNPFCSMCIKAIYDSTTAMVTQ